MKYLKLVLVISLVIFSSFALSACGKKTANNQKATETPKTQKLVELTNDQKPYISLIPRADGNLIKMVIDRIPSNIKKIDYELIYTAVDNGNEIEKGAGDTLTVDSPKIEKELLLGTESCTTGTCKYKYDKGVTGGTISLTLITADGQVSTYQSPFRLLSAAEFKKSGQINLETEDFTIKATPANKDEFFILIKNYGFSNAADSTAKANYSVFSSGNGKGKVTEVSSSAVKKDLNIITGDYLIN